MRAHLEADVKRDRLREAGVGDPLCLGVGCEFGRVGLEVERAQGELERAALGADQKRSRLGPGSELGRRLPHEDPQRHWQVDDEHDRPNQHRRLDAVVSQVAPSEKKNISHRGLPADDAD